MLNPDEAWTATAMAVAEIERRLAGAPPPAEAEAFKTAKAALLDVLDELAIDAYQKAAERVKAAALKLKAIIGSVETDPLAAALARAAKALPSVQIPGPLAVQPPAIAIPAPVDHAKPAEVAPGDTSAIAGLSIQLCNDEWALFGKQEYNSKGNVVRTGRQEGEEGVYQRIGEYWLEGTNTHGLDGRNHEMPWSAAFISWIMRKSGAGTRFRYSTQHSVYIDQAIRDKKDGRDGAGFWGWRLNECRPSLGDLVCWSREQGVDYDHQKGGNYSGHCDFVVEIGSGELWVIGGNVGDSVTRRPLPLNSEGYLVPVTMGGEQLFGLMQGRFGESGIAALGPAVAPPTDAGGQEPQIAWGKKVSKEFKSKILQITLMLGMDPSHLMAAIAFETGETFSPAIQNKKSSATGLIQFMPTTATSLGTSIDELKQMTAESQLDIVAKYLSPYKGRAKTLSDVYMTILYPVAVGKAEAAVLFSSPAVAYLQNQGLDTNADGVITKGEAAFLVQKKLSKGLSTEFIG
jgi:hypothetical protein